MNIWWKVESIKKWRFDLYDKYWDTIGIFGRQNVFERKARERFVVDRLKVRSWNEEKVCQTLELLMRCFKVRASRINVSRWIVIKKRNKKEREMYPTSFINFSTNVFPLDTSKMHFESLGRGKEISADSLKRTKISRYQFFTTVKDLSLSLLRIIRTAVLSTNLHLFPLSPSVYIPHFPITLSR